MKKPFFPGIFLLVLLYSGIFVILVFVQFTKRGGFTQRVGDFMVTGQYSPSGDGVPSSAPNESYLYGDTHVFFGGMDFCLAKGSDGRSLSFTGTDGIKEEILPGRMITSEDSVIFSFSNGAELQFATQYSGGSLEMLISGVFPEHISGAEIPFKPQRRAGIRDTGDSRFIVSADGVNYSFGRSPLDARARLLLIGAGEEPASYRAIPEATEFSPGDFILPQAETAGAYNEALGTWIDQNFSLWMRIVPESDNESAVVVLAGEALARGTYKAAVAAVSPAFLQGANRTYQSSVYLGDLNEASQSLSALDREKLARLSRLINERSLEFLKEPRVFEYFAVRGHLNFIDAGADLVRTIDPAVLALDIVPGILEGYTGWKTIRPAEDNPFERLVDQACFVVSESLGRTGAGGVDRVFSFFGSRGETEFNLRLGRALLVYAEAGEDNSWAGIGRSLILSALSLGNESGMVKAGLVLSDSGEINESSAASSLTTAGLYRVLCPGDYYPRAQAIGAAVNSIWTWTTAQAVNASQENNVLDIAVTFPAGETHYMIFRGMRPFTKIQLYNMDFRTDPQFERYDSSGWSYYAQEQTLIVKMKHQTQVEHIRIFY